jgi:uncharacterized radical SAM protein YgiQ
MSIEAMTRKGLPQPAFLPASRSEMAALGWDALDVLLVSGDAYVDHPSFGTALIGRWLLAHGYRVGIVAQPRWDRPDDVAVMGRPRLFAGASAGALDSMLAHYTAFRKKRHDDAYTPGGKAGARPNRACIAYTALLRNAFPGLTVVLGGVEASLRRAVHYDFWDDGLRRPILLDAKADLVVHGMAERAVLDVARRIESVGASPEKGARLRPGALAGIPGTVFAGTEADVPAGASREVLPSFEEILAKPRLLMDATLSLERQVHRGDVWLVQAAGSRSVVIAPPAEPLSSRELDELYALPFARAAHPSCREPVPAEEMIRFSITSHRGCAGGCSFCALALHQGRRVRSRSASSIAGEAAALARHPAWKGSISDVGGPTANMWSASCAADPARCKRSSCLAPTACPHFHCDQAAVAAMLREVARSPGVKHLRVASGVRHDLARRDPGYVRALVREFTGGQLKIAPEHCSDRILRLMRKPAFRTFTEFLSVFEAESKAAGKPQFVVPYLISAFPGCTEQDMRELAAWLKSRGWKPQQVQCFIPTPGTVASAMYYAGIDPEGHPIPVARSDAERRRQHDLLVGGAKPAPNAGRRGRKR